MDVRNFQIGFTRVHVDARNAVDNMGKVHTDVKDNLFITYGQNTCCNE